MTDLLFLRRKERNAFSWKNATPELVLRKFSEYLQQYKDLTDRDTMNLRKYWVITKVKKNKYFLPQEKETSYGFIFSGAVKLFIKDDKSTQVHALLTEGTFCNLKAFSPKHPISTSAICTEDSILVTINLPKFMKLITDHPIFLKFFADLNEQTIEFLQNRITSLQVLSAHERYIDLLHHHPEIFGRFNLSDVANYLGMKGETLSRIRKPSLRKAS